MKWVSQLAQLPSEAGKQEGRCSSTTSVPWEHGVSATYMDPQTRAREGKGSPRSTGQWESVEIQYIEGGDPIRVRGRAAQQNSRLAEGCDQTT